MSTNADIWNLASDGYYYWFCPYFVDDEDIGLWFHAGVFRASWNAEKRMPDFENTEAILLFRDEERGSLCKDRIDEMLIEKLGYLPCYDYN